MSLVLTIGANVDGATAALKDLEANLRSLEAQLKKTSNPAEIQGLTDAIVQQKNIIQQANASVNGFATSTFGVSRAARTAHTDVEDLVRSFELIKSGTGNASTALSNLAFSFERLRGQTGGIKAAFSEIGATLIGPSGIALAIGAAIPLISQFASKLFDDSDAAKSAAESSKKFKDEITGIYTETAKEATQVASLVALLENETETRQRKLAAIKELHKIAPDTFNDLKLEGDAVVNLDKDYQNYLENLKTVIAVKIKQAQLEADIEKLLKQQGTTLTGNEKLLSDATKKLDQSLSGTLFGQTVQDNQKQNQKSIQQTQNDIDRLMNDIKDLSKGIKVGEPDTSKVKKAIKDISDEFQGLSIILPTLGADPQVLEDQRRELEEIQKLSKDFNKGAPIQLREALLAPSPLEELEKQAKELQKTVEGGLTSAFENMFSAIENHKNPLKAFFQTVIQEIERLIAKLLAAKAAELLVSFLVPGGGAALGSIGSILGAIPLHAEGGIFTQPSLGIIGEAGPEVVMPLDKLGGILKNYGVSGSQSVVVTGRISGNDILLSNARQTRKNNRGF